MPRGTWVGLAEVVKEYLAKGKRMRVIGHLEYQTWTDKASSEQRSRAVIVASQVLFLAYDRAHTGLGHMTYPLCGKLFRHI